MFKLIFKTIINLSKWKLGSMDDTDKPEVVFIKF